MAVMSFPDGERERERERRILCVHKISVVADHILHSIKILDRDSEHKENMGPELYHYCCSGACTELALKG